MAEARYAALDVGGTKMSYALVDRDKGVLHRYDDVETPKSHLDIVLRIEGMIHDIMKDCLIEGIGISIAGPVTNDGTVVRTSNMKLNDGYPLQKRLDRSFFAPVSVENDARCFALGVHKYELEGKYDDGVFLTLGTGLGGAAILAGMLEPRPKAPSEEIGHMILVPGGRDCGCGGKGCAEAYVSGTAIEKRYVEAAGSFLSARDIAEMDDRASMCVMDEARKYFGMVLERLMEEYDPEAIVVGGGLSNALRIMEQECKVLRKSEMDDAALLGAVVPLLG
ncbi:MAG: ROK family protein [Candidatus Aenigmarchaeota archaeon]